MRMKKLFTFLLGLNASLGALAYNNPSGFSGVSFQDIGSDTQFIEMTTAGSLSTWAQNETELGYMGQTSRTKLVITGPMSASDFTALSGSAWDSFTTVDLSKVTVTDPTYISNMTLANAQTIILPNGLTKAQIESLKTEASGVVAGLVGTSETAYNDHYYYTLPGETEQEYTGTVSGSEGNYYFHETKTYQRPLTLQNGYPTFTWTDLLGETHVLTNEEVNYPDNTKTSWIPENVQVQLQETITSTTTITYTYNYTQDGQTYSFDLGNNLDKINTVTEDFTGTETTVKETFNYWTNNGSLGNYGTITISANDPVQVTITTTTTESYKYHHLTDTWEHWLDFTKTNDNFTRIDNVPIGTITNGGNNGTKEFPITAAFKYGYTDIRNNPLQYPAEGTLPAADDDGFVDWVFDEDVALRKVQIPYNHLSEVDGYVAYVNTAGSLSNVASVFYDTSLATEYRNAENITIYGDINDNDLAELSETNFASVNFLDMSGAVLTGDVTTLSSKGTAAIVLPNIQDGDAVRSVSNAEFGTLQAVGGSNPTFKCLAYLDINNSNKIYVYTIQCSSVSYLSSFVNTSSSLVFLPLYETDGSLKNYMLQYNTEIQNLLTYVKDLPALNIDFGMVYVGVSTDFSVLNENTHYIVVPVNGTQYDFTDEVNPYGDGENDIYKYSDNIYVVATYKNPEGIYATSCSYAGKKFNATEPTTITYVRTAGTLGGASGSVSPEMMAATRLILVGNLNAADVSAMEMMGATTFDFIDANISFADMQAFHNPNVQYLALADNTNAAIDATSADECHYVFGDEPLCPNLLCVAAYNTDTNTLTTWSSAPGNVYKLTSMIRPQKTGRGTGLICASLNNVVMSGYLNLDDIATLGIEGQSLQLGLEGATVKKADLSKAYFPTQTDMVFCPQYSAGGASWDNNPIELFLPTDQRQTLIPAHSLHGSANLNELCVPYNYETIGEDAFGLMGAKIITTTDADGNLIIAGKQYKETDSEGNLIDIDGDIIPNKGLNSFTLSSNLKSIGTQAFWTANKSLRDVYVMATTAPKCAANAFNSENYCGNIGFEGNFKHPITRENYHNGDLIWFTILHFPSELEVSEAKKYTDIDRDYSLIDETSAFDGKGQLKHWPNHSEISRAYDQALAGVTWNDWVYMTEADYNTTLLSLPAVLVAKGYTAEEAAAYVKHYEDLGYDGSKYELRVTDGGNVDGIGTIPDGRILATYYTEVQDGVTPETCDFYDYIGWHQFVLTDYYRYTEIEVDDTPKTYTTLDYYTLCFPYDLTRQEVIDLIGAPCKNSNTLDGEELTEDAFPEVYTLKSVTRNTSTQQITLGFSKELMAMAKTGKDITVTADGWTYNNDLKTNNNKSGDDKAIFLKGGYPYLVKPIVPEGTTFSNLAEYMMSISDLTAADLGYQESTSDGGYISVPYKSQGVISRDQNDAQLTWTDGDGNSSGYYYYFQGTYVNEDLPKYAYYLGQKNGKRSFFYNTSGTRKWNRFSAIIGGKCPTENPVSYIGFDHGSTSKNVSTVSIFMRNADDSFNPATNDVKVNFTFEGEDGFDEAVAIESINGESVAPMEGEVYNVTGQFVGKSVDGLSKGLYIINGKKVMVK